MDEPENEEPDRGDGSGLGTVGLVTVVFILGVVVGIPVALFGADVLLLYAGQVFAALFGVFLVALSVAALVGLFRKQIWRALFRRAEIEVHRFARPLAEVARFAASQRVQEATDAARDLAELVLARYAWVSTRRWMIATLTGLIAAIAALAGSALLFQQNQLLRIQGDLMAQQTERLNEQTKMLETQIQMGEAQRSSSIVPEILAIGATIGEVTADMPMVAVEAGSSMLPPALRARIVAATLAVRPYRYLVYGLDRLTDNELVSSAMGRRTDLAGSQEQITAALAEQDRIWGLAAADPRAETGELTDRIVSPERGHLLGVLLNSGLKDLGRLNHDGADFSFAEVRVPRFEGIRLQFAKLAFADFSQVAITGANFQAATLDHARFVRSPIIDTRFDMILNEDVPDPFKAHPILPMHPTRMVGTDLSLADIGGSSFAGVQALGANFDGAAIFNTSFAGAFMLASTFRNGVLYGLDFTDADLTKVDFDGAAVFEPDFLEKVAATAASGTFDPAAYKLETIPDAEMAAHPNLNALGRLPIEVQNGVAPMRLVRVMPIETAAEGLR
ncbi:MAG TPA: pentapeptide repeat-containing protein [Devosia sp.]